MPRRNKIIITTIEQEKIPEELSPNAQHMKNSADRPVYTFPTETNHPNLKP